MNKKSPTGSRVYELTNLLVLMLALSRLFSNDQPF